MAHKSELEDIDRVKEIKEPAIRGVTHRLVCEDYDVGRVWADVLRTDSFVPEDKYQHEDYSYVDVRYDSRVV